MKKNGLFAAMLVMVLALGVVWVGCDSATDDGGGNSLVASEGANKVGGKTYIVGSTKTEFLATAADASSGRYKILNVKYSYDNGYPQLVLKEGKYTYEEIENGAYSWNETAETVTMSPEKIAWEQNNGYGALEDKTEYKASAQAEINRQKDQMGEEKLNEALSNMGFSSIDEYIDYIVAELFANKTYNYAFSTDNAALFLDEVLPANKGTNELSGQTYNGVGWAEDDKPIKDTTQKYIFTPSDYTYTNTERSEDNSSGTYAYDSTRKAVWFKPSTADRQAQYDALVVNDGGYYASIAEYKAAQINREYRIQQLNYDTVDKTIR
jgi:hypothetical protein